MFKETTGGYEVIQGLKCWKPKVGYLWDPRAKEGKGSWVYDGIHRRSTNKVACWWEIDERFLMVDKWRKEELEKQKSNPDYLHPQLEAFIDQCWLWRRGGIWFNNGGTPTYLTGVNWYFLSCYKLPGGAPEYRDADREYFYAWQFCLEDPNCYGLNELTKRRSGKSFRAGCIAIEAASRTENFIVGIQSKTDKDAEKMFKKTIIAPYRKLPFFFKPETNLPNNGKMSASQLVFETGKANIEDDELASRIDYESSKVDAYDGQELALYIADEVGKSVLVDVNERWETHKFCLHGHKGDLVGKTIHTSTVEKLANNSLENYRKLYFNSDQFNKVNGRTITGMYDFYMPADRVRCINRYGMANRLRAKEEIMQLREAVKHDPVALARLTRKESLTVDEAFMVDASRCIYNPIKLAYRLQDLNSMVDKGTRPKQYQRGNFVWADGDVDGDVAFVPNPNGRFQTMYLAGKPNQYQIIGNTFRPLNNQEFSAGIDPVENKYVEKSHENRKSKPSLIIKKEETPASPAPLVEGNICCFYCVRPEIDVFYEDMIKCLKFYGCDALIENNKSGLIKHMEDRGYLAYAYSVPGREAPGLPSSPQQIQYMTEITEQFIDHRIDHVYFPELVQDWINFEPDHTRPYDAAMAFGYCETRSRIKSNGKGRTTKGTKPDIEEIFDGTHAGSSYVLRDLQEDAGIFS